MMMRRSLTRTKPSQAKANSRLGIHLEFGPLFVRADQAQITSMQSREFAREIQPSPWPATFSPIRRDEALENMSRAAAGIGRPVFSTLRMT